MGFPRISVVITSYSVHQRIPFTALYHEHYCSRAL